MPCYKHAINIGSKRLTKLDLGVMNITHHGMASNKNNSP